MTGEEIRQAVKARFPEAVISDEAARDMDTLYIKPEALIEVCTFLRDDPSTDMAMLTDETAIDWATRKSPRFELVILLLSFKHDHRIRLKVPLEGEYPEFDSLVPVWKVANWLEREIYDMFGIRAKGHPNLRRILTHEDFEGHPLRKEYPVNRRQPIRPPVEDLLTPKPYLGSDSTPKA